MSLVIELCLIAGGIFLFFDIMAICRIIMKRLGRDKNTIIANKEERLFLEVLLGLVPQYKKRASAYKYFEMKQSIQLDKLKAENIEQYIDIDKMEKRQVKRLESVFETSRMEAAAYLGLIGTDRNRGILEESILREKSYPAKLYMANALSDIGKPESIPILVSSLINAHRWYREKVNMLISDFGEDFNLYLPHIIDSNKIEIIELIVDFSSVYFSETLKNYLIDLIDSRNEIMERIGTLFGAAGVRCCANCSYGATLDMEGNRICRYKGVVNSHFYCNKYKVLPVSVNSASGFLKLVYKAADILARIYPQVLDDPKYLNAEDIELKNIAVRALSSRSKKETVSKLADYLKDDEIARSVINSISIMIERNPEYINIVIQIFDQEKDMKAKQKLAKVLSGRIEYFIMKLTSKNMRSEDEIIKQVLLMGRTSEVIDFLNKNKDIDIENELIAIVKTVIDLSPELADGFLEYLSERLILKCGLKPREEVVIKKEEKKDKKLMTMLYLMLAFIVMLFPLTYAVRHFDLLFRLPALEQLKIYVIDFNYYLAYYSIAINLIYIALLILSFVHVRQQQLRWKIKNISLLFKKKMLPSISIVAPAFNEEKTIIESANSLLNLKYPDYELIIVNDGSKDRTLEVLIKYYDLIRVDHVFEYKLNTKPIRGIYMNRSMPKLMVVDKANGGKADSLNAGINISNKEYFCCIDADSLLEDESLLKLTSLTLDKGLETPALGGNIFPINGCTVKRGYISNMKIPSDELARFQTVEYIRAFMAGRLGWAALNSLLIISGAFGLFRKERVINIGGYLTSSGKFAKDTVGEDMELVVRICRLMRELGNKYSICYAFNANCWTEVPEDLKSLKRQRYRWHRGLIDILTFHRKMIFNPRYGRTGMLAMPYFLIFEMIGPMIEIQGYLMVIVALMLGILNTEIALLLFTSTIFMGVLISISSMLIAERDFSYFKLKEILVLIGYSIVENFGPRQLFSFWRVGGYFSMLRNQSGWGKPERKGFEDSNPFVKA